MYVYCMQENKQTQFVIEELLRTLWIKIAKNHQTSLNERKETVLVWDLCFQRKPIKLWFNFMRPSAQGSTALDTSWSVNSVQHSWKWEFNICEGEFRILKEEIKLKFLFLLKLLDNPIPLPRLTKIEFWSKLSKRWSWSYGVAKQTSI